MRSPLWLVLAATACSSVLGIDELEPDTDRDSVTDAEDRCPGFDDRIDEDGDGVPDACDNCPNAGNADQANADADAAGDACDPDTGTATCAVHERILFDGFNRESLGDWTIGTGAWVVGNGELLQPKRTNARDFVHLPTPRLATAIVRVTATLRELGPDDTGLMVATSGMPGGANHGPAYLCFANATGANHSIVLKKRLGGTEPLLASHPMSGRFVVGSTLTIVAESYAATTTRRCDARQLDPVAVPHASPELADDSLAAGEVMLITEEAAAAFLSVDILTVAGPCP